MKKQFRFLSASLLALGALSFSCDDDSMGPDINDPDAKKGNLNISVTDAPIDADNVSAVFVTFTEIKVDGHEFTGFEGPKTVNLLELQNGNTMDLGTSEASVGSYSKIEFVINSEYDADSTGPGCYILNTDGTKEKLELGSDGKATLTVEPDHFDVSEDGTTEIVIDFDLRKAIKANSDSDFEFVSKAELNGAVRAENKEMTGNIKGTISNSAGTNLVVYVYKKGEFNEDTEIEGSGDGEVKFGKALTSATVNAGGNFTLAYLPEGDYEIYCDKPESDGLGIGLNTLLELNSSGEDLENITVDSGTETTLSLSVVLGGLLN